MMIIKSSKCGRTFLVVLGKLRYVVNMAEVLDVLANEVGILVVARVNATEEKNGGTVLPYTKKKV